MPQVTITHPDDSTETIDATTGYQFKEEIGEMWRADIRVERSAARAVTLNLKEDAVELAGYPEGRLVDVDKSGAEWVLIVYSKEWDGRTVEPIAGGTRVQGDDAALLTDLIGDVPSWSVGSVADLTGPMTFVLNHAFTHEAMRRIERNVPGELEWEGDGTVNYVENLGAPQSGTLAEVSPSAGTLNGDVEIKDRGRTLDATHVRVIGAHEGEAQRFANLVPDDDPASYENRVDYTTGRWAPGETRNWARWANKDVMANDTITEEASTLGEELQREYLEVVATTEGLDLSLGDWVRLTDPEHDIDRDMRVHRLVTRTVDGHPAAVVQDVTLSTRTTARDTPKTQTNDIQRFNTAFQGSSVIVQGGGGRQPVASSINAEESFRYPPVEFEHEALVEVASLPYRAYSSGSANNADFETTVEISNNVGVETIPNESGYVTIDTVTVNEDTSFIFVHMNIHNNSDPDSALDGTRTLNARYYNATQDYYLPFSSGTVLQSVAAESAISVPFIDAQNVNGDTLELQVSSGVVDAEIGVDTQWYGAGLHDHDPEPGVIESFPDNPDANAQGELLPSNVDILVNGNTVATDVGSGEFTTVVDITDEMNRDAFNDISATSDTLGHIQLTPYIESYKQIGSQ